MIRKLAYALLLMAMTIGLAQADKPNKEQEK